jgi:hypothetical protein
LLLLQDRINFIVISRLPYSRLLFKISKEYAEWGLSVLMYPQHSLYCVLRSLPICLIYINSQVDKLIYILHSFQTHYQHKITLLLGVKLVYVGLIANCIGISLNVFVTFLICGPWNDNLTHLLFSSSVQFYWLKCVSSCDQLYEWISVVLSVLFYNI